MNGNDNGINDWRSQQQQWQRQMAMVNNDGPEMMVAMIATAVVAMMDDNGNDLINDGQ